MNSPPREVIKLRIFFASSRICKHKFIKSARASQTKIIQYSYVSSFYALQFDDEYKFWITNVVTADLLLHPLQLKMKGLKTTKEIIKAGARAIFTSEQLEQCCVTMAGEVRSNRPALPKELIDQLKGTYRDKRNIFLFFEKY